MRVLCFSYAGGGVPAYRPWAGTLGDDVEICIAALPGRAERYSEPAFRRVTAVTSHLVDGMATFRPVPRTVLYGHSFGAVVAFDVARALAAKGLTPDALIAAARPAPHLPFRYPLVHGLSDLAFLEELNKRYGGAVQMLLEDEALRDLALPPLRADMEALETYELIAGEPLALPLTVLRGKKDLLMTSEDAAAWRELAAGPFEVLEVDAGHFFLETHRAWVLDRVRAVLKTV